MFCRPSSFLKYPQSSNAEFNFLQWNHLLTKSQLEDIGYQEMTSIPHYLQTETKRLVPFARWFSPEDTHDIGLWPDMAELQAMMLEKDFEKHLQTLYGPKNSRRGRIYEVGLVLKQGWHVVQQGRISKKNDPQVNRMIVLISRVANKLLEEEFPDREKAMQHRLWTVNASFTFGSEDNKDFTSIQLNYASVEQNLSDALGQFGALHIDGGDNPLSFTGNVCSLTLCAEHFPRPLQHRQC